MRGKKDKKTYPSRKGIVGKARADTLNLGKNVFQDSYKLPHKPYMSSIGTKFWSVDDNGG